SSFICLSLQKVAAILETLRLVSSFNNKFLAGKVEGEFHYYFWNTFPMLPVCQTHMQFYKVLPLFLSSSLSLFRCLSFLCPSHHYTHTFKNNCFAHKQIYTSYSLPLSLSLSLPDRT